MSTGNGNTICWSEWNAGNRSIFDLKCTVEDINDAHDILNRQKAREARGEYKRGFRALEQRRYILKPRVALTTHPANYSETTEEDIAEAMNISEDTASPDIAVKSGTRKRKGTGKTEPRKVQRVDTKEEKEKARAFKAYEKKEKEYKEKRGKQVESDTKIAETIKDQKDFLIADIRNKKKHEKATALDEKDVTDEYAVSQVKPGNRKYRGKVPPRPINPNTGRYVRRTVSPSSSPPSVEKIPQNCIPDPLESAPPSKAQDTYVRFDDGSSGTQKLILDTDGRYYYINKDKKKIVPWNQRYMKTLADNKKKTLFELTNKKDKNGLKIWATSEGRYGYPNERNRIIPYEGDELKEVKKIMESPQQPPPLTQSAPTIQQHPTQPMMSNWSHEEQRRLVIERIANATAIDTDLRQDDDSVMLTIQGMYFIQRPSGGWTIPVNLAQSDYARRYADLLRKQEEQAEPS